MWNFIPRFWNTETLGWRLTRAANPKRQCLGMRLNNRAIFLQEVAFYCIQSSKLMVAAWNENPPPFWNEAPTISDILLKIFHGSVAIIIVNCARWTISQDVMDHCWEIASVPCRNTVDMEKNRSWYNNRINKKSLNLGNGSYSVIVWVYDKKHSVQMPLATAT